MHKGNGATGKTVAGAGKPDVTGGTPWVYPYTDSLTEGTPDSSDSLSFNDREYIPRYKINPTTVVKYWMPLDRFKTVGATPKASREKPEKSEKPEHEKTKAPESSATTGELSKESGRRLKRSINAWSMYQKVLFYHGKGESEQLNLLTLTLPAKQLESDKSLKDKAFRAMLQWLDRQGVWYVWKAEPQANGNLHFHLAISQYLPIFRVQTQWNKLLKNYVARYKARWQMRDINGFKFWPDSSMSYDQQVKAYQSRQRNGYDNPNTADIKTGKGKKDLEAYLAKYVAKSENRRPVQGRLWGRSNAVKEIKEYDTYQSYDMYLLEKRLQSVAQLVTHEDHFSCYYGKVLETIKAEFPNILGNIYSHCLSTKRQINSKCETINPP